LLRAEEAFLVLPFDAAVRLLPPPRLAALEVAFLLPADLVALLRGAAFLVPPAADFCPRLEVLLVDLEAPLVAALLVAVLEAPFLAGTFAPRSLASESPIAIAWSREVTFFPLRPLFSSPCFISCMAFSTFSPAVFEYLAIIENLRLVNE
jgi:hypothetical protein